MKKLFLLVLSCFVFLIFLEVNADNSMFKARIGNNFYDTLEEAILNASSTDTISLTSDVSLNDTVEIKKNVNINLNNHDIEADNQVFLVQGGSLNVSGKGTIRETKPYYGAIVVVGSEDKDDVDYSTISIGKDVTLEGWSGIFIDHSNKKSYGVLVNMNGSIKALNDIDGDTGVGVYVNGYISDQDNAPVINLSDTVVIESSGVGIYSAGYAHYYIDGAKIEGVEAGLGIKSGTFKMYDGTILGTGEDKTPTSGNNDGINPSGAAIQIESNNSYAGDIELDIRDGIIMSKQSYAIYEYTVNTASTKIKDISLSGGKYIAKEGYQVIKMSDSFNGIHNGFISGGSYSTSPSSYLEDGYSVTLTPDSQYEVVNKNINKSTNLIGRGDKNTDSSNNNWLFWSFLLTGLVIIIVVIFINLEKILRFLRISK